MRDFSMERDWAGVNLAVGLESWFKIIHFQLSFQVCTYFSVTTEWEIIQTQEDFVTSMMFSGGVDELP